MQQEDAKTRRSTRWGSTLEKLYGTVGATSYIGNVLDRGHRLQISVSRRGGLDWSESSGSLDVA